MVMTVLTGTLDPQLAYSTSFMTPHYEEYMRYLLALGFFCLPLGFLPTSHFAYSLLHLLALSIFQHSQAFFGLSAK